MDFLYRPPKLIRKLFPGIVWENTGEGIILTVDDGPSENSLRILDCLEKYNLKAIFFCTGENIEKYLSEFEAISKAGHVIGNHSYSHKKMILRSLKKSSLDIEKTSGIINCFTGMTPTLFRPPFGLFNPYILHTLREKKINMFLWSFLTGDHTGNFSIVKRLTDSYLRKKSIIVMHDNSKSVKIFSESIEYIVQTAKCRTLHFENSL